MVENVTDLETQIYTATKSSHAATKTQHSQINTLKVLTIIPVLHSPCQSLWAPRGSGNL